MFIKKKKVELKEQSLAYYEEKSYMYLIPKNENWNPLIGIYERVADIDGVKIIDSRDITDKEPGYIKISYEDEEYELGFYPNYFKFDNLLLKSNFYFTEAEVEKLNSTKKALVIYMKFGSNPKKSFHLQLKLADAIMPDMLALMDESAERLLPAKWVSMKAESDILPGVDDLFAIHGLVDGEKIWLYTLGLARCGITELEILESDKENYNNHYHIIRTYGIHLIENKGKYSSEGNSTCIGMLSDKTLVVATCLIWTKALELYPKLNLGNFNDRKTSHNSKTSVIFLYQDEKDEVSGKLSNVSIYNNLWGENPIFFISTEETARMQALAIENFDYLKDLATDKDNEIIIKVGLEIDDKESTALEHIWFELLEIDGDSFKAKLTQEPYNISGIHEGDVMTFNKEKVTDWIVYTKKHKITPNDVYILEK